MIRYILPATLLGLTLTLYLYNLRLVKRVRAQFSQRDQELKEREERLLEREFFAEEEEISPTTVFDHIAKSTHFEEKGVISQPIMAEDVVVMGITCDIFVNFRPMENHLLKTKVDEHREQYRKASIKEGMGKVFVMPTYGDMEDVDMAISILDATKHIVWGDLAPNVEIVSPEGIYNSD